VTRQAFPDWAVLAQRRTSSRSGREPAGNCLDQLIAGDGKASILPQQANGYQECANAGMAATIATPRTVELYRASVMERLDDRFHESCHKRGIHLSSQTPISAVGGLETKDEKEWQRGGGRLKCRLEMRTSRT
jgi:hypothetical protein